MKGNHKEWAESRASKNRAVTTLRPKGGRDDVVVWILKSWKWKEVSFLSGMYSQFNIIQQERSQKQHSDFISPLILNSLWNPRSKEAWLIISHTLYLSWWRKRVWNRKGKYKISSIVLQSPIKIYLSLFLFVLLPTLRQKSGNYTKYFVLWRKEDKKFQSSQYLTHFR